MKLIFRLLFPLLLAFASLGPAETKSCGPLAINAAPVKTLNLTASGVTRKRDLPVRVYLPVNTALTPVILFSHGLGGNHEGSKFLGEHWAAMIPCGAISPGGTVDRHAGGSFHRQFHASHAGHSRRAGSTQAVERGNQSPARRSA